MDLDKTLRELYEEKKRLNRAIERLETRLAAQAEQPKRSTRGRKSMGPEERKQVSARMAAYWAAKRARLAQGSFAGGSGPGEENPEGTKTSASA